VSTGIITQHAPAAASDPMSVFSNVLPGRSMNTRKAFTQQQQQEDEVEEMVKFGWKLMSSTY
jgi:hypothetical protein